MPQWEAHFAKSEGLGVQHLTREFATQLRCVRFVLLAVELLIKHDDAEIVFRLFLSWPAAPTSCVVLLRVGSLRRLSIVLLFYMSVQSWVAQVALTAATDKGPADVVIF